MAATKGAKIQKAAAEGAKTDNTTAKGAKTDKAAAKRANTYKKDGKVAMNDKSDAKGAKITKEAKNAVSTAGANTDKENQKSSETLTTSEKETKNGTNIGKFVHFSMVLKQEFKTFSKLFVSTFCVKFQTESRPKHFLQYLF